MRQQRCGNKWREEARDSARFAEVGAVEAISREFSSQSLGIGLPKVTRAGVVGGQRG